jgi:hypothetical protein
MVPGRMTGRTTPERRLLFWLWSPFVADVLIALLGVVALAVGNTDGWYLIWFAIARAVIGIVAVAVVAPRVLGRRRGSAGPDSRGHGD